MACLGGPRKQNTLFLKCATKSAHMPPMSRIHPNNENTHRHCDTLFNIT